MACIIDDNNSADNILGCTDPVALNYDTLATVDDGTCIYVGDTVNGCKDPLAINYNPLATVDDSTCIYEDCPTEFTIRPSDGAVFYTESINTDTNGIEEPNFLLKTDPPTPVSLALSEFCCTEEVVNQVVVWNGEFCVLVGSSPCPHPLAITIGGVVIGSDGVPVNSVCCDALHNADWDPNFVVNKTNKPGACIDRNVPQPPCDLSMLDLTLNDDGTITTTTITTTVIVVDPVDDPDDPCGDDDGLVIEDVCVNIDNWFASKVSDIWDPGDANKPDNLGDDSMLIRYTTIDTNVLLFQNNPYGNIAVYGFEDNGILPIDTCYNLDRPTLNGYTAILDISTTDNITYTITTAIHISTLEASEVTCTPTEFIDVSGHGVICEYYGDIVSSTPEQICVDTQIYQFNQLSWVYSTFISQGPATEICGLPIDGLSGSLGGGQSLEDFNLVLVSSDPETLNLIDCGYYDLGDAFKDHLQASCFGIEHTYADEGQGGQQTFEDYTQIFDYGASGLSQLFGTAETNGVYISIWDVVIPQYYAMGMNINFCQVDGQNVSSPYINFNSQTCVEGNLGEFTQLIDLGSYDPGDNPCDDTPPPPITVTSTTVSDISENCCTELGGGLWTYINGECYWDPPKVVVPVSIGISENDIIIIDRTCDTLTVCVSLFLEKPDDPKCHTENEITASLGAYSDDITNNVFNITEQTSYSSVNDGYCTWVRICGQIQDFDGTPFKLKLNLDGTLDCCEYDIYVDDISVSCIVQDAIEVSTRNDCPGFTLNKVIDNKKSWVYNDGDVINRVFAPSVDADIPWRYTNYVEQSNVWEKHSKLVLNSKELYLTFNMCTPENCSTPLNVFELIEYKNNFQNFWVKFIEQFVPATTIFVSGEKWCNKPNEICKVIDECGYENDLSKSDMGTKDYTGGNTKPTNNSGNKKLSINKGSTTVTSNGNGDYGSDNNDPVILNNFIGSFLQSKPSETEKQLTFPKGVIPLLKVGTETYRNKMRQPTNRLIRT